jgi:hypothetical protein
MASPAHARHRGHPRWPLLAAGARPPASRRPEWPPDQERGPLLYLGTHLPSWLADPAAGFPLMVSYHRLAHQLTTGRPLRPATHRWALDSGAYTELARYGRWTIPADRYVADVARCQREIGMLDWAAPQDWPCEPDVIHGANGCAGTGLSVPVHQHLTLLNYVHLCELWRQESDLPCPFIPVVQGWTLGSYDFCANLYAAAGIDLATQPMTGLGSVCRRQGTINASLIVSWLASSGLRLHAFGIKTTGIAAYGSQLASFDTLAWSYAARRSYPMPGHTHRQCSSCLPYATAWRARLLNRLHASTPPWPSSPVAAA